MKINILGSEWTIEERTEAQDVLLKAYRGYCDPSVRLIIVQALSDYDSSPRAMNKLDYCYKKTLRHEIIHAYLFESGLSDSACSVDAWATNEEMVDWFAAQWCKIQRSFEQAGCALETAHKDDSPDEYTAEEGDE